MGVASLDAGTVKGVMDTLEETVAEPAEDPSPRPRRGLDRRTVAICVCVALVAAIVAGLLASIFVGDDEGERGSNSDPSIQLVDQIDARKLFATELRTVDGQPTTLEAFRSDQPLVVNIWAQSCVPCVDEMPLLEQASKANPDVAFVGVHSLDPIEKAKVMAAETGITYPWVDDPTGDFFFVAKGAGMPTTFIVMPSGEVVATKTGAFDSEAELQGWLDRHVA
jgi:thiol-disulfide isomerase/thioredoxin